mmetsp:Transcript_88685/g.206373  ORF Transcript_88685/g.206373 Transcript_88685/m.206373 type:complete len:221 (+) Transcript_88685:45-707(+)
MSASVSLRASEIMRHWFGVLCCMSVGCSHSEDSFALFHVATRPGVDSITFRHNATSYEPGTGLELKLDRGCNVSSASGSSCQLMQGDNVHVKLTYSLEKPIEAGSLYLYTQSRVGGEIGAEEGSHSNIQPLSAECPVCGGMCDITWMAKRTRFRMPECPIRVGHNIPIFDADLELPRSPFLGEAQIRTQITVVVKRTCGDGEASILVVDATMGFGKPDQF